MNGFFLLHYSIRKYYVKVIEQDDINYKLYLWPFAIVVAVCFVLVMVFVVSFSIFMPAEYAYVS